MIFTAALSNHHHTGIIDVEGRFPEFLAYFHKLFAKHRNVLPGRWENFWASEQTSVVELVTPGDILDKMVYAITNPVKDNLVEKVVEWPGVDALSAIEAGVPLAAQRPTRFFRPDGDMDESVSLEFHRPPGFEDLSHEEFASLLRQRLKTLEAAAAARRTELKIRVLGRAALLRQSWRDSPRTREPRRRLRPRVACRNIWRRVEALHRNGAFLDAYAGCRLSLLAGNPTPFSVGTYWLPSFAAVPCEQAPPTA